jgi:DNA processing protein
VASFNLKSAQKIVHHFPDPAEVFRSSAGALIALGVEREVAAWLASPKILEQARREIELLEKKKYSLLTRDDDDYPGLLREIFDPPCVLYCAGRREVLGEDAVAVIGARRPSAYGRAVSEKLAAELASRGVVVISGMARGIDSQAHWGALKEGKTVAVLGSGLEDIYPPENRKLFSKIAEKGVVITEYPLDSPPLAFHFPLRNRIISGLSQAVVVVEATRRSGSLITARLALEQNREVMAVPGNITSELSQGTHWLIKAGAKLVESWEDVAEELAPSLKEKLLSQGRGKMEKMPQLDAKEGRIFSALRPDSLIHIDELAENTEFSVSELLAILLSLELKGLIVQSPGKYYQRSL